MPFKKKYEVVPLGGGGFAVGLYGVATGQVYSSSRECQDQVDILYANKNKTKKK